MKIFQKPIFWGIIYLLLIPTYAIIYLYLPKPLNLPADSKIQHAFSTEPFTFIQSLYFSVVTITTLGFGDISPNTNLAQIITASEVLFGVLIIGVFLNSLAQRSSVKLKESVESIIIRIIERILHRVTFVISNVTLNKIPKEKIRLHKLSKELIEQEMSQVFFSSKLYNPPNTVGQSVADYLTEIQFDIERLVSLSNLLDIDLISILSKVDKVNETWVREYKMGPIIFEGVNVVIDTQNMDISRYSSHFYNLHNFYLQLYNYQKDKLIHFASIKYRVMSDNIIHLEKYNEGLKLAKTLYKHADYKKNALFLSIVANAKLNNFKKAKTALKTYIKIGPENSNFVRQSLEQHYTKQLSQLEVEKIFEGL
jgi:Ion channel